MNSTLLRMLAAIAALALCTADTFAAVVTATYNTGAEVPVTANGYTATGNTVNFTLNYAPVAGTQLMVVKNTGLSFISGTFSNLAQGQTVPLTYNGVTFNFVANYYGGTGNDLVLVWKGTRTFAWGDNVDGELGNNSTTQSNVPVAVDASAADGSALSGKTVVAAAAGEYHSLALCSDGTVVAWGDNTYGELGDNGTSGISSSVPVAVDTSAADGSALSGKTVVAVTAGYTHSVALCSDGTVAAWGYNNYGQLGNNSTTSSSVPVAVDVSALDGSALSGKTVVAVAAGYTHSVALCSDGTVVAWGYNHYGELGNSGTTTSTVPVAVNAASGVSALYGKTVVAVAAGAYHSVALCSDGTVAAWGLNINGQLGNSGTTSSSVPVEVTNTGVLAEATVVAVVAGSAYSLAFCSPGPLAAWGANYYGQLGNNSTTQSNVPVAVDTSAADSSALSGKTVVAVAAGGYHSVALCSDGTVAAWGYNFFGQLGNNSTTQSNVPVAVSTTPLAQGERFSGLFQGSESYHSLALVADAPPTALTYSTNPASYSVGMAIANNTPSSSGGAVVSYSVSPALPAGLSLNTTTGVISGTPAAFAATATYTVTATNTAGSTTASLSIAVNNLAATYTTGNEVPWTANGYTATGDTVTFTLNYAPAAGTQLMVVKNTGLSFISGTFSNLAQGQTVPLTYNGATYNFVANYYGGTGNDLVLVWKATRTFAWGYNGYGELGNSSTTQSNVPVAVTSTGVLAGKTVVAVAAGAEHSLALCSDGTVAAWGYNAAGQLGNNSTSQSDVPVAVDVSAADGSALAGKTVVAVAAGGSHNLALCSTGTVVAWGYNSNGQLGNASTIPSTVPETVFSTGVLSGKTVVAVAAGDSHSLALCSDGTVAAWGLNNYGQLGTGGTNNSLVPVAVTSTGALSGKTVVAVAAGGVHSVALCSDGTVAAWGQNTYGQLGNNSLSPYSSVPVAVNAASGVSALYGRTVVAVAAGDEYSLALCSDGTVAAWGYNANGRLGNNSYDWSNVPVAVDTSALDGSVLSGKTVVAVAAGAEADHSVALCSDGTVAAWGLNTAGELGNNSTTNSPVPVAVSTTPLAQGERFSGLFQGSASAHSLALVADAPPTALTYSTNPASYSVGTAIANNTPSSSGGAVVSYSVSPALPAGLSLNTTTGVISGTPTAIAPTATYTVTATNTAGSTTASLSITVNNLAATYTTGNEVPLTANGFTATGNTVNFTLNYAPAAGTQLMVVKNTGLSFISGTFSNLAQGQTVPLTYNGVTYNFVANYYGGTGNDLVLVWKGTRTFAWGNNEDGELGDNSTTDSTVPVAVDVSAADGSALSGKTVVAGAAGTLHSVALCSDGTVAAWGWNYYGQLGNSGTTQSNVPVAVTTTGVLSGKTVVAVAAGYAHSVALCSDGTVATWGWNGAGQLGNNNTTNSNVPVAVNAVSGVSALYGKTVVAVAAGYEYSLALCSDGTVAAWGDNSAGQFGNNNTTNSNVPVAVNAVSGVSALYGKTVVAVGAGAYHSVALCSDGTVAAWGDNSYGQLGNGASGNYSPVPVAVNTASGVSTLYGKTVVAVAAGGLHSLALCSDGTVAAWGQNTYGQLGNNSLSPYSSVPVAVNAASGVSALYGRTVVAVAAGDEYSLALCSDGTVAAWGDNYYGELGDSQGSGYGNYSSVPVAVSTTPLAQGERFSGLFQGSASAHSLALVADAPPTALTYSTNPASYSVGTAIANNTPSSSGGAVVSYSVSPALPAGLSLNTTTGVISGTPTAIAPTATYTVTAANYNNSTTTLITITVNAVALSASYTTGNEVPLTINGLTATDNTVNFTLNYAPAAGTQLMVVKNTGLSFISGTFSNLAQGQTVPLTYNGVTYNFVANYYGGTGNDLVLAWKGTRSFAWGYNVDGQLGNNSTTDSHVPVAVTSTGVLSNKTVVAAAAGEFHSVALCSDGTVAAWGDNPNGELGNNSTTNSNVPVAVTSTGALSGKTVVAVAAGAYHSLALCSDGTVAAWGYNYDGELGNNSTTNSNVPVAVTSTGALSGKTVVAVAAGANHSVALCSDGTVATWGYNYYGQLGTGGTTSSLVPAAVTSGALSGKTVVAVAAGANHSVALCSDGTVAAWGYNGDGELGNNSTIQSNVPVAVDTIATDGSALFGETVVAVAAGAYHSLALCSDGTVATWGFNFFGQFGNNSRIQSSVPVAVDTSAADGSVLSGKTVVALAAGTYHSMAFCSDDTVAAWGYNFFGQLGDNSTTQSNVPVAVSTTPLAQGERFSGLFQGSESYHSLALVADAPPTALTYSANPASYTVGTAITNNTPSSSGSPVVWYSVSPALPAGLSLNTTTGVISGTPTAITATATYTVTAANYGQSTTASVSITVNKTIQSWRQTWYGTTSNTGNAADSADPYQTGLSNLEVYAFFGPNQNPAQASITQMPQAQMSGGNFYISFIQPAGVSGITYGAQWRPSLTDGSWLPLSDTGSGSQHIFSMPMGSHTKLFIRLTVSDP